MIQRLIYTAMEQGLAAIKDDPTLLDMIFGEDGYGFTDAEMVTVRALFNEANCPPISHGYPKIDSKFPAYFLVLLNEIQSQHLLGDYLGMEEEPTEETFGMDYVGAIWTRKFNLLCYSEHPELTLYMYEIAKYIMQFNQSVNDVVVWSELAGGDFLPDLQILPFHVFGRVLTLTIKDDHGYVNRDSRLQKAFQLSGIHVPNDVAGVATSVTIVEEDV